MTSAFWEMKRSVANEEKEYSDQTPRPHDVEEETSAALPDNNSRYSLSKEQTINQPVLLELMIDEALGFLHLVSMSGIRSIQGLAELRDIDCLISTVRPDSRSVLRRFCISRVAPGIDS